jgi:hypothetical protein
LAAGHEEDGFSELQNRGKSLIAMASRKTALLQATAFF